MKRFVAGADRTQSTLLPECLDDFIDESNPVRVIDAFVETLPKVATEMALHVLAYNLTRVLNIFGVKPMLSAVGA
jgi:transposase